MAPARRALIERFAASSPFFVPEGVPAVIDHALGRRNLNREPPFLSVDEKRALGLNTRQKLSHALVAVLSAEGRAFSHPKDLPDSIRHQARGHVSRRLTVETMRSAGIKTCLLKTSRDGRDCEWSCAAPRRFTVDVDIQAVIEANCDALYCRCWLSPDLPAHLMG